MAEDLEILLKARDEASATIGKVSGSVDKLGTASKSAETNASGLWKEFGKGALAAVGVSVGIGQVVSLLRDSIKEFMEGEAATARFNQSLRNAGAVSNEVLGGMAEFADEMAGLAIVDDDVVKGLVSLGLNLGISKEKIQDATRTAMGLAEALGISAEQAMRAFARAAEGDYGQLERLSPQIRAAGTDAEKMAEAMKIAADGFSLMRDRADTSAGSLQKIGVWWGNFKESVGDAVVSFAEGLNYQSVALREYQKQLDEIYGRHVYLIKSTKEMAAWVRERARQVEKENALEEESYEQMCDNAVRALAAKREEEKKAVVATKEHKAATVELSEAYLDFWADRSTQDAMLEVLDIVNRTAPASTNMARAAEEVAESQGEQEKSAQELVATMELLASAIAGVNSLMDALGVSSDSAARDMLDAASGAITFAEGLKSGNAAQIIGGIASAIGGLIKGLKKLFGGDGRKSAVQFETAWMGISKDLQEQLYKLADQCDNTHEAASIMLDTFMQEGEVSLETFGEWARRLRDVLSDLDQGTLSETEAAREMGDAFSVLIDRARELGTEGSADLLALYDDLRDRGLQVAEVNEYMAEKMTQGLEGYKAFLAGGFSDTTMQVFEDMLALEQKVADNQAMVDGVKGLGEALIGLSATAKLSENQFQGFEDAASDAFASLTGAGFTSDEALKQMQPLLQKLAFLQEQFGYEADATTQSLIDQARAAGLITVDPMESAVGKFGAGTDVFARAVDRFARGMGWEMPDTGAGDGLRSPTGGASGRTKTITGNQTVNINLTGGGVTGQQIVDLIRANSGGLADMLKGL